MSHQLCVVGQGGPRLVLTVTRDVTSAVCCRTRGTTTGTVSTVTSPGRFWRAASVGECTTPAVLRSRGGPAWWTTSAPSAW